MAFRSLKQLLYETGWNQAFALVSEAEGDLFVTQRWANGGERLCTVTADCWCREKTGGINTILMTLDIRVCVWESVRFIKSQPVRVGPDWPGKNNYFIMTERPQGIPEIETFEMRRWRQGEEGSDKRNKMGCLCSSLMSVCGCVHSWFQKSTFWGFVASIRYTLI